MKRAIGYLVYIPLVALLLAGEVLASEEEPDLFGISDTKAKVSLGGYSFWQIGQIVDGYNFRLGNKISHYWENNLLIGLTINARPHDHLNLVLNPEFYLNYPFPQQYNSEKSVRPFGIAYIKQAYGEFNLGDLENPFLSIDLGMFSYKYNRDVRNLGEYLFRTGTYPTYIINEFDYPAAQLLGLRAGTDVIPNLHADLLLTSEALMYPLFDFSLSFLAKYNLFDAAEIGAGIDFARCFPVDGRRTTPTTGDAGNRNKFYKANGDSGYYSFKATKLMAHATIDPKKFFGSPKIFGPEDLKIYGEICAVGLKGYDAADFPIINQETGERDSTIRAWYNGPDDNGLNRRTPRMVGFNFPTFRALDVLSFELEYFPSGLPNDFSKVIMEQHPEPFITGESKNYSPDNYDNGSIRWSIYAKKMVINGFSVIAAAAFDHYRTTNQEGVPHQGESLTKSGNWHWKLKFLYSF